MFKKLFRSVKKFFKNLFKDPLRLLLTLVNAVLTVITLGTAAPLLYAQLGLTTLASQIVVGVGLTMAAVGFDLPWLEMLIAVVGLFASGYMMFFQNFGIVAVDGMFQASGLLGALGVSQSTLEFLYNLTFLTRAIIFSVMVVITAGLSEAIEQDISLVEGVGEGVGGIAESIGDGLGRVIDGVGSGAGSVFSALANNVLPYALIGLGIYAAVQFLRGSGESSSRQPVVNVIHERDALEAH